MFRLMILADISQDERIRAAMAAVENAAQLVIVRQKSVGFVNQKGRRPFFDDPEHNAGSHIAGRERHQPVEQVEQDCFARSR